uniref:Uncharacterized protein n=1 Tax=Prymnesium polylepis TaxID=72548 RepID=A0A6T8C3U5_9EUKA|mmetsp:Transcript_408/g.764  ORF Transcript_408/g.764 Transcript_408/m.764 type:complete len:137 (+) Transcript_408:18-428(+)
MPPSFIESPFRSKVEYDAYLSLPAAEQEAAWAAAVGDAAVSSLSDAAADMSMADGNTSFDPLDFPPARRATVKKDFEAASSGNRLPLKEVHALLFTPTERTEYDFDTWDQDLQATCEGCSETMGWADVEKFLAENL